MPQSRVNLSRLVWVGPLTVLVAIAVVLAVRAVAFALLDLPAAFPPLTYQALLFFTVVLTSIAVAVFAVVAKRSVDPAGTYRRIALIALLVSLLPDLALPFADAPDPAQAATWPAVFVLMVMHVAVWWPTVRILTTLGLR